MDVAETLVAPGVSGAVGETAVNALRQTFAFARTVVKSVKLEPSELTQLCKWLAVASDEP